MKTYRVWFRDGSALLVNAATRIEAAARAKDLAKEQGGETYIQVIERLDGNRVSSGN